MFIRPLAYPKLRALGMPGLLKSLALLKKFEPFKGLFLSPIWLKFYPCFPGFDLIE